jgi:branched-subunit amino acid aminotransferase/4-amino-4-deoxychorismate lyase
MTSNFFYLLRPERSEAQTKGASSSFVAGGAPHSAQREILFTAQRDVLLGVTRRTVTHLARGRGLEVQYQALKLNQLSDVKEAFITSSSRGVVPVIQIDGVGVGQGSPGQITRMLMSAYDEYVLEYAEKI